MDDGRNGSGKTWTLLFATLCVAAVIGGVALEHSGSHPAGEVAASHEDFLRTPATDPSAPSADSGTFPVQPDEPAPTF